ncbi:Putative muramidase [Flavobacterium indicum GPTSA100-9 = DSM 17447]|uniref:Peptidoglycan hydrolase n=1 Tax=Flavobacterium indicum (strain DSM 17447 / CIP 109464 / GPTSA100-9) TaxID=1094466 RepID=H8XPP4_FLAIG|nr:glucosaminidase domain-containing protein [Flavobacterium indicum]CCG54110.1 Putative muramidase [Flavobacterium indicum GPTSA100-9 = DSM 17447]
MIKKIVFFFFTILVISCGSSKVRTSKTVSKTTYPSKNTTTTSKPTTSKPKNTNATGEILVATSKVKATTEDVKKYIEDFKETAKSNMKQYGIPASIIMAQGILESGAGFGRLCKEANNHFGIKCHTGWTGETVTHDDDALQECFRKYKDPAESYRDHALFLTSRKRYESLFKLDKGDYQAWANGLKQAGYATDTLYPSKLVGIIERYELYKLDNEVLGRNFIPTPKQEIVLNEGEYVIQKGDTLYSLSKKFNLSVEELKQLNNISDTAIAVGQKIKTKK